METKDQSFDSPPTQPLDVASDKQTQLQNQGEGGVSLEKTEEIGKGGKKGKKKPAPKKPKKETWYEELSRQIENSQGGSVLREMARLQLDCENLRSRVRRSWVVVILLALCTIGVSYITLSVYPKYRYIPVSDAGAVCEVYSRKDAPVSHAALAEWARNTVVNSYTYDYINWKSRLEEVGNKWYTTSGKLAFRRSLMDSRNLERIIQGRYILRATPLRAPVVVDEKASSWVVDVPITIEFFTGQSDVPQSKQDFNARVTLRRIEPTRENLHAIATDMVVLTTFRKEKYN